MDDLLKIVVYFFLIIGVLLFGATHVLLHWLLC